MTILDLFDMVHNRASFSEFEAAAKQFFRAQFKELNCVGSKLSYVHWMDKDNASPFFVLCQEIANKVVERYEFYPFEITLTGSKDGPEMAPLIHLDDGAYYGLRISTTIRCVNLLMYANTATIEVSYVWPDCRSIIDDGSVGMSSHSSKDYSFDLTSPDSVERITACVLDKCDKMVRLEPA